MTNTEMQVDETSADVVTEMPRTTGAAAPRDAGGSDEFKLTIRKLEMPVRPRGVLAE